jgi:hypothetical protein
MDAELRRDFVQLAGGLAEVSEFEPALGGGQVVAVLGGGGRIRRRMLSSFARNLVRPKVGNIF